MESFEQVKKQYTPMIYKIISTLKIYQNKDEFFQIGLIALWEAYERFDAEKGEFKNYAYSYIKGRMMTEMTRSNKRIDRETPVQADWDFLVTHYDPVFMEEDILLSYCQAAELTENQRKWVLYTFLKQLTVAEIAYIEGVSESAVKKWRTGARQKLKKLFNEAPIPF